MTVEWIEPIYDRTYSDVLAAEADPTLENPKGCYNNVDLNRIENNTQYVMEDMVERKIIKVPPTLAIKTNWTKDEIPTRDSMARIIQNVQRLMDLSNPEIVDSFDTIYDSTQFPYTLANAIEKNLNIMKNQPELPIQKWLLTIENGTILEYNSSTAYLAEDEIVTIEGVPYGEDAQYMIFEHWSGNPEDLQYVENTNSQKTTFTMKYHDLESYSITLTAQFKTRLPRTLTLHGGTIHDDIGGTTRTLFGGDKVLLLADSAALGKVFYEWQGTREGIDNLTGGEQPSTSWLIMPDCDVELTSFYINAGQHSVTVDGVLQGWYDYNDYVYISPSSRGSKWTFSYWSGDTGYLEDVTSSSFQMPDVNVKFTSNWTYNYSYNTVNVINGTINGASKGEKLREGSGQSIMANEAPAGQGFYKWELEGVGSFAQDEDAYNSSTLFYIGDGNAVLTATYKPSHYIQVNNSSGSGYYVEDKKYTITADKPEKGYTFSHWEEDGKTLTQDMSYTFTMGKTDRTITASYKLPYQLTVINGTGSGTYSEGDNAQIVANEPKEGYLFAYWKVNSGSVSWLEDRGIYNSTTTLVIQKTDVTVEAIYQPKHTLTVHSGVTSGEYWSGQEVEVSCSKPEKDYEFAYWTDSTGKILSYANPYKFNMPDSDYDITANYKAIPYFTVTVINGTGSGTYIRNSSPTIMMDPAPEGKKFFQWEILVGDDNDVTEPLASTTTIRNLTHNVEVQATYYIPDTETPYTLTIVHKDGSVETQNHTVGEQVRIYADDPDEGYEFIRWTGDVQYLRDRYATPTIVNMPAKNIQLEMKFDKKGAIRKYHVKLNGGQLLVKTLDDGTEEWDIEGEFEEKSVIPIKAVNIPLGWRFNGWKNDQDGGKSVSTVNELYAENTFLTVQDFAIELTGDIIKNELRELSITNGEVSGSYLAGESVSIYSHFEDTETIHYRFIRWSGNDLAYIKLADGGSFDIYKAGTGDDPQVIIMPDRNISITANYEIKYRLKLIGGTNPEGKTEEFYMAGTPIKIKADEAPVGQHFSYWKGNIEYLDSKYSSEPTLTMPKSGIELIAVYVSEANRNDVALSKDSLYDQTTIDSTNLEIISGKLELGCIIIDSKGHIYTITKMEKNTLTIYRLTQKQGGTTNGE